MRAPFDIVVPTIGRPSLAHLLTAVARSDGPLPGRIILVDDRREPRTPLLAEPVPPRLQRVLQVVRGAGRGPASARNVGWRVSQAAWIAFLDDDVVPAPDWLARLADDLAVLAPAVAGSQGRIHVPLPASRAATDWERNVRALEVARWATADIAYRRTVLESVGGFDERFPRPYREDADLGLRVVARGHRIVRGRRRVAHPVGPADRWVSVRLQAGNADDAVMAARHGPRWRTLAGAPRGRRRRHALVTVALAGALTSAALGAWWVAAACAVAWAIGTAELAWARIAPGPRTLDEIATMVVTSALIPPMAIGHWLAGMVRHRRAVAPEPAAPVDAVLLDRDGTLITDVPDNSDPGRIVPMPGAHRALERLRTAGVRTAVVTNQSGIGRGTLRETDVTALHRRVEELMGPLGPWLVCPHVPADACGCRKPAPGLIVRAAAALGVAPERCVVIGDIGADVEAARGAGARAILVPTPVTRTEEIVAALEIAPTLDAAVDAVLALRPA
jgi:histidinol-phosphate phosphatase family protein